MFTHFAWMTDNQLIHIMAHGIGYDAFEAARLELTARGIHVRSRAQAQAILRPSPNAERAWTSQRQLPMGY